MLKANPEFLWIRNSEGMSIFHYAVLRRQAKIFSLIYGLKGRVEGLLAERDKSGNTILHLAGMLTEHTVVDKITGAALQMEREVEWFKVSSLLTLQYFLVTFSTTFYKVDILIKLAI